MALDLDPGAAGLGNAQLISAIIDEMDGGAIPFERFMELALYHPEHGYYRKRGRIGPEGDFLTSPQIHPMFGWAIAAWTRWLWQAAGKPEQFTIFEPAAGEGHLAASVLDWVTARDPDFAKALHYVAIEPNSPGDDPRVEWAAPPLAPVEHGLVVSNEFFDALPVRLFDGTARGPQEVYVRWNGEAFEEVAGPVAVIEGAPQQGRFEVNARAFATMTELCALVERGAVLTIDYGYPREELWAPWRTQGTLLAFYRHTAHENPYIHVGEQDLTAHVDLSDLEAALAASGFETYGPVSQASFLFNLGGQQLVDAARSELQEFFSRRLALEQLTDSGGLGRIRVLAGLRGIDAKPPGFEDGDDPGISATAPAADQGTDRTNRGG